MAQAVVFRTPGLIPIEAFTHFGVNAKPNSTNPIGYFGTGLKYAIAVLCREGFKPIVWIGNDRYEFFPKDKDFRGKEFTFIRMKKINILSLRKSYHDLPFTTELGKNWELWMAFRELESNTRDEDGTTEVLDLYNDHPKNTGQTVIAVEGQTFVEVFRNINEVFLDPKLEVAWEDETVQIFSRPSEYIYYRGLRAYKAEKPTKLTYNLLDWQTLTEDRTLAYPHTAEQTVGKFVALTDSKDLIRKVVEKDDSHWEGSIRWNYVYHSPGDTFKEVLGSASSKGWTPSYAAHGYYSGYVTPTKKDPLIGFPRPWEVDATRGGNHQEERYNAILDANGKVIFDSSNSEHRKMDYEEDDKHGGTWKDTGTYGLFNHIVKVINEERGLTYES